MFRLYEKINHNETYFIAEMSANHGGSLETALKIVREAVNAGADCLKIQTYKAETMTLDSDLPDFQITGGLWDGYNLYRLYEGAATPYDWHEPIKKECEKCGIDFLSTPFDKTAVDFLENLGVEAYKVASYELVDIPLIQYIASKHKPMIISVGMGSVKEIRDCIDTCKSVGNEQIVLLKCCSEYPAPWKDMKLGNIPDMKERFGYPVGLSDHSFGCLGAVVGVTLGACVIEKHVKLTEVKSADSEFSMTMDDYKIMVESCRNAKMIAFGPSYCLTTSEQAATVFRRSIYASANIKAGEKFSESNVRVIRPGYGLKPKYLQYLIGTTAKRDITIGERIISADLPKEVLIQFFEDDMIFIYEEAKKQLKYSADTFLQMIKDHDAVYAAKWVINTKEEHKRLKRLRDNNRLDLSVEEYVLKSEYETLFTEDERKICMKRLGREEVA